MSEKREKGSLRPIDNMKMVAKGRVTKGLKPNTSLKPTQGAQPQQPPPPTGGGSTSKSN